jgi:hypothetical protein
VYLLFTIAQDCDPVKGPGRDQKLRAGEGGAALALPETIRYKTF